MIFFSCLVLYIGMMKYVGHIRSAFASNFLKDILILELYVRILTFLLIKEAMILFILFCFDINVDVNIEMLNVA